MQQYGLERALAHSPSLLRSYHHHGEQLQKGHETAENERQHINSVQTDDNVPHSSSYIYVHLH